MVVPIARWRNCRFSLIDPNCLTITFNLPHLSARNPAREHWVVWNYSYLIILKATLGFFFILMAHRLRATVEEGPRNNAPWVLPSLAVSSPLLEWWSWRSGGNASADFELPAEPRPAPHDSMELRRDLSVSVVQALSLCGHATTYRRTESTTHFATHLHRAHYSLTSLMCWLVVLTVQWRHYFCIQAYWWHFFAGVLW